MTLSTLGPRESFTDISGSTVSSQIQQRQPSRLTDLVEVAIRIPVTVAVRDMLSGVTRKRRHTWSHGTA